MPFVRVETNVERNAEHAGEFLKQLSALSARLIGKPEGFVMVSAEFGRPLLFGGTHDPAAFVRLESLDLEQSQCPELASELCGFLKTVLDISPDRVFIGFGSPEREMFGWNSTTFG